MTVLNGTTPVSAPLSPGRDDRNTWPTHKAEWGQGGLKFCKTIAERDAISNDRKYQSVVFVEIGASGKPEWYYWTGTKDDGTDGEWLQWHPPVNVGTGSLDVSDGTTTVTGVSNLNLQGMYVGDDGNGAATLVAGPNVHMDAPNQQYGSDYVEDITILPPLNVYDNPKMPTGKHGVVLEIKPGTFEPMHSPGFLAYLKDDVEIVGRPTDNGHHNGAVWFEDIVISKSPYIGSKRITKSYSIEEADDLDPNISGGTTYIVGFRAGFKGAAPDDGFIRIYLYNTSPNPYSLKGYLLDDNGQPMVVERRYKAGDTLDSLEVIGAVTAKGQQEFSCHIVHNFTSEKLVVADPVENLSGLLIQAITPTAGTGDALQQYELDTQDDIVFVKHYLGEERATLQYALSNEVPMFPIAKGNFEKAADGWTSYAVDNIKAGVTDNRYVVSDNGVDPCDFTLGKVFSSEETKMLRGKDIEVTVTLTDKSSAYKVVLMKWMGKPNEYTPQIFAQRKDGLPVWSTNWLEFGELFVVEDAIVGDFTMSKTFVVPTDAVNYGVFIYPAISEQPMVMKLKELKLDVNPSFVGVALKEICKYNERHLYFTDEFKQFVQNTQGNASLRYTINANELPAPCGVPSKGLADIVKCSGKSLDFKAGYLIGYAQAVTDSKSK